MGLGKLIFPQHYNGLFKAVSIFSEVFRFFGRICGYVGKFDFPRSHPPEPKRTPLPFWPCACMILAYSYEDTNIFFLWPSGLAVTNPFWDLVLYREWSGILMVVPLQSHPLALIRYQADLFHNRQFGSVKSFFWDLVLYIERSSILLVVPLQSHPLALIRYQADLFRNRRMSWAFPISFFEPRTNEHQRYQHHHRKEEEEEEEDQLWEKREDERTQFSVEGTSQEIVMGKKNFFFHIIRVSFTDWRAETFVSHWWFSFLEVSKSVIDLIYRTLALFSNLICRESKANCHRSPSKTGNLINFLRQKGYTAETALIHICKIWISIINEKFWLPSVILPNFVSGSNVAPSGVSKLQLSISPVITSLPESNLLRKSTYAASRIAPLVHFLAWASFRAFQCCGVSRIGWPSKAESDGMRGASSVSTWTANDEGEERLLQFTTVNRNKNW